MSKEAGTEKLEACYFAIEIEGIETARFFSCTGLEMHSQFVEINEGGFNSSTRKFPGPCINSNIVLEKGVSDNSELFNWYFQSVCGEENLKRKNGSVVLKNGGGTELKRWNFYNGFPVGWKGPHLEAQMKFVYAVERIEIAHEGLQLDGQE